MLADYSLLHRMLTERRSIRRFRPDPVPTELQEALWDACLCAPSAGNRQPYRLVVVESEVVRSQMASAVRAEIESIRGKILEEYQETSEAYFHNFLHFQGAPLVVAPIRRAGPDMLGSLTVERAPGASSPRSELETISSLAAAITQLLLACHALGLGACWMTGPLLASEQLEEILGVPGGWRLSALVPIGYPDETPAAPPKRKRDHLVRRINNSIPTPTSRE